MNHFFFSFKHDEKGHSELLLSLKGQVTFPETLTLVYNPILASQKELQLKRFSQSDAPLQWNTHTVLHLSQTSRICPLPIFLLYSEVGLSAQIWFTPFKNKSGTYKAENSGCVVVVSEFSFLCLETTLVLRELSSSLRGKEYRPTVLKCLLLGKSNIFIPDVTP